MNLIQHYAENVGRKDFQNKLLILAGAPATTWCTYFTDIAASFKTDAGNILINKMDNKTALDTATKDVKNKFKLTVIICCCTLYSMI